MKKPLLFVIVLFAFIGCTGAQQAARDVGQPIGGVVRIPQSISEGAAEGFVGEPDYNPYGR